MRQRVWPVLTLILSGFLLPQASAQVGGGPWIGEVLLVPYNFAPAGWAFCSGQLLPISQNTALFALLGTTFGGDGIHTFALPDLRGRSPIGSGQGPGLQNYFLGQTGGEEQVTLTVSQIPAHHHAAFGSSNTATSASPGGLTWAAQTRLNIYSSTDGTAMAPSGTTGGLSGVTQPHDNRSPYLTLNYIIALQGIFPARQ
jgi:microcystin-dependent protein